MFVLGFMVMIPVYLQYQESLYTQTLESKGISLVQNLAFNSETGVLEEDRGRLTSLLDGVMKDDEVLFTAVLRYQNFEPNVFVLDRRRTFDLRRVSKLLTTTPFSRIVSGYQMSSVRIQYLPYPILYLTAPITSRVSMVPDEESLLYLSSQDPKVVGYAIVAVSMGWVIKEIAKIRVLSIYLFLGLLGISLTVFQWAVTRLLAPLSALKKGVQLLKSGGEFSGFSGSGRDDFFQLGYLLNGFVEKVTRLKRHNKDQILALETQVNDQLEWVMGFSFDQEEIVALLAQLSGSKRTLDSEGWKASLDSLRGVLYSIRQLLMRARLSVESDVFCISDVLQQLLPILKWLPISENNIKDLIQSKYRVSASSDVVSYVITMMVVQMLRRYQIEAVTGSCEATPNWVCLHWKVSVSNIDHLASLGETMPFSLSVLLRSGGSFEESCISPTSLLLTLRLPKEQT
ncbi:hypothetical protein HOH87_08030 [bacterium]|nr:hypothetical protein [bacterium]